MVGESSRREESAAGSSVDERWVLGRFRTTQEAGRLGTVPTEVGSMLAAMRSNNRLQADAVSAHRSSLGLAARAAEPARYG